MQNIIVKDYEHTPAHLKKIALSKCQHTCYDGCSCKRDTTCDCLFGSIPWESIEGVGQSSTASVYNDRENMIIRTNSIGSIRQVQNKFSVSTEANTCT